MKKQNLDNYFNMFCLRHQAGLFRRKHLYWIFNGIQSNGLSVAEQVLAENNIPFTSKGYFENKEYKNYIIDVFIISSKYEQVMEAEIARKIIDKCLLLFGQEFVDTLQNKFQPLGDMLIKTKEEL